MPLCRSFLVLLLCAVCAPAADIALVKGEVVKGDVVRIDDKQLVSFQAGAEVTHPIIEILKIDFREIGRPTAGTAYADVELTDGTVLHCSKWSVKKANVEMTLLTGPTLTVPLSTVSGILNEANKEENRKDWVKRTSGKRTSDVLVRKIDGVIQGLPCTLGEGDDKGESIEVTATIGEEVVTRQRKLDGVQGLLFRRTLDPKAPPATCKLLDTMQNVVMVSGVDYKEKTLTVTTPSGAKLEFPTDQVARIDYTKGRYEYLSEMTPLTLITRSNVEDGDLPEQQHIYKDISFKPERKQIQLAGVVYPRGLVVRPYTEMVFDLKGDYNDFSAVVGLEDGVGSDGPVVVEIEADGASLGTFTFKADDKKRSQEVKRNVKGVQRLRIVVKSGDLFDLGKHTVLADAKVSK
jgi:hypothetical protein